MHLYFTLTVPHEVKGGHAALLDKVQGDGHGQCDRTHAGQASHLASGTIR